MAKQGSLIPASAFFSCFVVVFRLPRSTCLPQTQTGNMRHTRNTPARGRQGQRCSPGRRPQLHGLSPEGSGRAAHPIGCCRCLSSAVMNVGGSRAVLSVCPISSHTPHVVASRVCLSRWCPSTAWAACGLSGTRRRTAAWLPPSVPPSPSSMPSPTGSSRRCCATPGSPPPPPHPVLRPSLPPHPPQHSPPADPHHPPGPLASYTTV